MSAQPLRILVTGANGFIARHTCQALRDAGFDVVGTVRDPAASVSVPLKIVPTLDKDTDWRAALEGIDTVVHVAARVHVFNETAIDPAAAFRAVNTDGTLNLAQQAAEAGTRRFVFLSTLGVHGSLNHGNQPMTEESPIQPYNDYAQSKWEAEVALQELRNRLPVTIVRAPLVYGAGAPGNFTRLLGLIRRGIPLPFASVRNKRSFISVQNFADVLRVCVDNPQAQNAVFLVSDGVDVSTPELIRTMADILGENTVFLPFPTPILEAGLALAGRGAMANQLFGSLTIDMRKAHTQLGWQPPLMLEEGLRLALAQ